MLPILRRRRGIGRRTSPIDGHAQPPRPDRRRRVHARKERVVDDAVAEVVTAVEIVVRVATEFYVVADVVRAMPAAADPARWRRLPCQTSWW